MPMPCASFTSEDLGNRRLRTVPSRPSPNQSTKRCFRCRRVSDLESKAAIPGIEDTIRCSLCILLGWNAVIGLVGEMISSLRGSKRVEHMLKKPLAKSTRRVDFVQTCTFMPYPERSESFQLSMLRNG